MRTTGVPSCGNVPKQDELTHERVRERNNASLHRSRQTSVPQGHVDSKRQGVELIRPHVIYCQFGIQFISIVASILQGIDDRENPTAKAVDGQRSRRDRGSLDGE